MEQYNLLKWAKINIDIFWLHLCVFIDWLSLLLTYQNYLDHPETKFRQIVDCVKKQHAALRHHKSLTREKL